MAHGRRRACKLFNCILYVLVLQVVISVCTLVLVFGFHKDWWMYITYLSRPVWDSSNENSFIPIQHYYTEGIDQQALCKLHGWKYSNTSNKVIDAIIFANELDLLEIRLRELYSVVDKFVIVESATTFTGNPKPTHFHNNRKRFAFAEDKIVYGLFKSPPVTAREAKTSMLEDSLREFVTIFLEANGIQTGDLVIMADTDEIPSKHTISLVKHCSGYPTDFHLGMRNYLYSFEFPLTHQAGYVEGSATSFHWRPRVHTWQTGYSSYNHSREADYLLVDAGWHCSFCFPFIEDFIFKMTAYSHSDRVRHESLLQEERIQRIICEGSDIFGILPEVFSYYDLLLTWQNPVKSQSLVHLPAELVAHPNKYQFLLPGHCIRKPKPL